MTENIKKIDATLIDFLISNNKKLTLQFTENRPISFWQLLNESVLAVNPNIGVRLYGNVGKGWRDLSFLEHLHNITILKIDELYLPTNALEFLKKIDNLIEFSLGATLNTVSLKPLEKFSELRKLFLEGEKTNLNVIAGLPNINTLLLADFRCVDFNILSGLKKIEKLHLISIDELNLELLNLPSIKLLAMQNISKITRYDNLNALEGLVRLILEDLDMVNFPNISKCEKLGRISIDSLERLINIENIKNIPNLEELVMCNVVNVNVSQYLHLIKKSKLKKIYIQPLNQGDEKKIMNYITNSSVSFDNTVDDKYKSLMF